MIGVDSFSIWLFDLAYGFFLTLADVSLWLFSPMEIFGLSIPIVPVAFFFGAGLLIYLARIVIKFFSI